VRGAKSMKSCNFRISHGLWVDQTTWRFSFLIWGK